MKKKIMKNEKINDENLTENNSRSNEIKENRDPNQDELYNLILIKRIRINNLY